MRKIVIGLGVILLLAAVGGLARAGSSALSTGPAFEPGTVLAGFRSGTAVSEQRAIVAAAGAIDHRTVGIGTHVLKVKAGNEQATIHTLLQNPSVRYAEVNGYVHTVDTVPNDPSFGNLWGLNNTGQSILGIKGTPGADIHAEKAWDITTGTNKVVVATVDTGIDYNHPDLIPNLWSNPGGLWGCPAGTHGANVISYYNAPCDPNDDFFHGTHVAGTIGAAGNNAMGVSGINWTTQIMAIKAFNSGGGATWEDTIAAEHLVTLAKMAGVNVRVVNNSWGGGGGSQGLLDEINLQGQNDILFVAAAGNNGTNIDNNPFYPASYNSQTSNMLVAAATTNKDLLASFSNWGPKNVDIGAPGVNVLSTTLNGGYGYASGTSMASPHVVGSVALILSLGDLHVDQIKKLILAAYDPLAVLSGKVRTGGRLNVCRALPACVPTKMAADPAIANVDTQTVYLTLTAHIAETETGAAIAGRTITFLSGATTVCSAVSDSKGTASCGTPIDAVSTILSSGYDASFAGDTPYKPSSAHGPALHALGSDLP